MISILLLTLRADENPYAEEIVRVLGYRGNGGTMTTQATPNELLRSLRAAIATGDPIAILEALPEPPHFLPALFRLEPADRDAIIAGLFPALPTDEDRWELIEASAMDTIAHGPAPPPVITGQRGRAGGQTDLATSYGRRWF
jgi:hypothetical protein